MENFLLDYLQKHYQHQKDIHRKPKQPGPVVTISRQAGCGGNAIAKMLAENLNEFYLPVGDETRWEVVSKKILENSARELKTKAEDISFVFESEQRTLWDDFMQSVTAKDYHSEWKIKNTIKMVIRDFAVDGHAIILGRGGAQITRDIEKSLHIKIVGPINWRAERIAMRFGIKKSAALKQIKEADEAREKLIKMLYTGCEQDICYDVTYNVEKISNESLISDIIHLMQHKKLV